jgi:hypothetical protein
MRTIIKTVWRIEIKKKKDISLIKNKKG